MTTASQAHPEAPRGWAGVLGLAFAIYLGSGMVGLLGGFPLYFGLFAWLAGPAASLSLPENYFALPAEAQAFLLGDGLFLCGHLFAAPAGILLLRLAVPRPGPTAREYLGLKWPGLRQGLGWGLLLLASDYGYALLVSWLGISLGEDGRYREIASTPLLLPLAFVAIAVLAPIFEELLFRGFLLEGLRHSRLGETGAILLTAALWTVMHPGTPARLLGLLLYGSLLALARLRTGSTYLAVLVHAIGNAVAVLAMADA